MKAVPEPIQATPPDLGESADKGSGRQVEQEKPGLATATLAELYASQGHLDRALGVYRQLVASQPNDAQLRTRMEELEMLVKASQEPAPPQRGGSPSSLGGPAGGDRNVRDLEEAIRTLEGWLAASGRS
jgi:hypothetical protein